MGEGLLGLDIGRIVLGHRDIGNGARRRIGFESVPVVRTDFTMMAGGWRPAASPTLQASIGRP